MDVNQPMATPCQEEILMDILKRLPVRSLLRFKCVSKYWNTLISDPYFKVEQLSHAKHDKNSHKLLTYEFCPKGISPMYCCPLSVVQHIRDLQKLITLQTLYHVLGYSIVVVMAWLPSRLIMLFLINAAYFCYGTPPQENQQYFQIQNLERSNIVVWDWVMTQLLVTIRSLISTMMYLVKFSR